MSNKREPVSKKLRFEIFKRDKFRCQYCGRSAPEVVLELDHVKPVFEGGETHILNLVTSCFDCNRGKTKTLLSDDSMIEKQKRQLEELEERRQQIEMMMEWHNSLKNIDSLKLDKIVGVLNTKLIPFTLNNSGIEKIRKYIKNYELIEVLEAIDCGIDYYFDKAFSTFPNKDEPIEQNNSSWKKEGFKLFLDKFPGILRNKRKEREDPDYPFILQIYKHNREYSFDCYDYGFSFISTEKNYKRLKACNLNPEKCIAIMCYKRWYDSNEMVDFINEKIKEFPLDFSKTSC